MKNIIITATALICIINCFSQRIMPMGIAYNPKEFNSNSFCATGRKVCSSETITREYDLKKECENDLNPKFFKLNFNAAGQFQLNSYAHTGTFVLYGPYIQKGIKACDLAALNANPKYQGNLNGLLIIDHQIGYYILKVHTDCISLSGSYGINISVSSPNLTCDEDLSCTDCIGSFSPQPGKYIISAWVKGEYANRNTSYLNPGISIAFVGNSDSTYLIPSGQIIDDWQRIDGMVNIPSSATSIKIRLHCKSGNCSFDDIRFHPVDASMISYVYDPINLRLVAQLDERNFATFYDYDEEGKLIRVKKETEKGIMTIQENRDNTKK